MTGALFTFAGGAVLAGAWLGPLAEAAHTSLAAQMLVHMLVVAVAAPLLALGLGGAGAWPGTRLPAAPAALVFSLAEFLLVWAWHVPPLHDAARYSPTIFVAEQGSFLTAGLLLWTAAFATGGHSGRGTALCGALALFFTSMHMTLLGVLLTLAPRPLYPSCIAGPKPFGWTAIEDQQVSGVVMLAVGGAAYLAGGLFLAASALAAGPRHAAVENPGSRS